MRVLALDSSGLVATVALVEEEQTLAEYTVNYKMTHSQTLLPMLDEIVRMLKFDLASIDAIAVAGGPGSFTGLRIGSATAKGLGLALDKPLIQVPTVDGMAYNLWGTAGLICPVMDARRNQVYTGIYCGDEGFQVLEEQMAISVDDLIARLKKYHQPVSFLGDGVPVYREQLEAGLKDRCCFVPAHLNRQRASAVGVLGIRYYQAGKIQSAAEYKPEYLRMSQAEREQAEKEKAQKELPQ